MKSLSKIFDQNRAWAQDMEKNDPRFFERLTKQQKPEYLWVGCSDSRTPANTIMGLDPGEVFVHRNVANLVVHSDLNFLSVLQYAVEVLKVQHVIVCGHYGCGGVKAAMGTEHHGLIDNWLRNIKDIYAAHYDEVNALPTPEQRTDRLCELNVIRQVHSVCHTTIVQDAWARGQKLTVHGWIYKLSNGHLQDLGVMLDNPDQINSVYRIDPIPNA